MINVAMDVGKAANVKEREELILRSTVRTFKRSRIREIVAAYSSLGIQESLPPFSLPSLSFQE